MSNHPRDTRDICQHCEVFYSCCTCYDCSMHYGCEQARTTTRDGSPCRCFSPTDAFIEENASCRGKIADYLRAAREEQRKEHK